MRKRSSEGLPDLPSYETSPHRGLRASFSRIFDSIMSRQPDRAVDEGQYQGSMEDYVHVDDVNTEPSIMPPEKDPSALAIPPIHHTPIDPSEGFRPRKIE